MIKWIFWYILFKVIFKNYYFNINKRLTQITNKEKSINLGNNTKSFFDLYNKSDVGIKKFLIKNINRAIFVLIKKSFKDNNFQIIKKIIIFLLIYNCF